VEVHIYGPALMS